MLVSSLEQEFAAEVRDLLIPTTFSNNSSSGEQEPLNSAELFTTEELGDREHTQLLCRMQQLLGDRSGLTDGRFLKELFLHYAATQHFG